MRVGLGNDTVATILDQTYERRGQRLAGMRGVRTSVADNAVAFLDRGVSGSSEIDHHVEAIAELMEKSERAKMSPSARRVYLADIRNHADHIQYALDTKMSGFIERNEFLEENEDLGHISAREAGTRIRQLLGQISRVPVEAGVESISEALKGLQNFSSEERQNSLEAIALMRASVANLGDDFGFLTDSFEASKAIVGASEMIEEGGVQLQRFTDRSFDAFDMVSAHGSWHLDLPERVVDLLS